MSRVAVALLLISVTAVATAPGRAASAAPCLIQAGRGIGAIIVGMPEAAAIGLAGRPLARQTDGRLTIYTVSPPFHQITIAAGVVQRVSTRARECRTPALVGPGATEAAARTAVANAVASTLSVTPEGDWLSYPFNGVAFLLRAGRVTVVEVFAADRIGDGRDRPTSPRQSLPGPAPAPARPAPTAEAWTIRALQARMDGLSLVVTGTVENVGRPGAVYAEVTAFDPNGRQVGSGDGPMTPLPGLVGGSGTFEARIVPSDVVARVVAVVRPVGMITGALAEQSTEITNRQQFVPVVAKRLQITTQILIGPPRAILDVRNDSAAAVAAVGVIADLETRCFVRLPRPGRFIVNTRARSVVVPFIVSGGSARATVTVEPPLEACEEFVVLSVKTRIADLRVAD